MKVSYQYIVLILLAVICIMVQVDSCNEKKKDQVNELRYDSIRDSVGKLQDQVRQDHLKFIRMQQSIDSLRVLRRQVNKKYANEKIGVDSAGSIKLDSIIRANL